MITVLYNIGSKPHTIEFENAKKLGEWITINYRFKIININIEK